MRHRKKIKMSEAKSEPWEDNFRLPLSVHPDHYDLYLYPNLNTKTFSGNVAIEVTSSESRDYFLVHTKWLNISSTSIVSVAEDGGERNIELVKTFEYEPNEFWVMKTKGLVGPGLYKIKLNFSGSLTKGIVGFYYSEYLNESGVSRGLATTKFEPTYCRQAFPSFDEPTFKSTYSVTIVKPSRDYIALSNMPVESEAEEKPEAGLTEVTFEKSVPMVTYLVCFIVCDFTYKEEVLPSKMPFRVYGPKERIDNTQYSLEIGQKILQYYEKVFKIPFPLPKSDMAAIPDYSSGATEHWGIITFRESNLFYNENASSATNHQRVSSVVAHELAHQWFGNLVTLNWWNDLWLNEGFASYIEGKGVAEVHPDWDMEVQFIIGNLQRVFVLDSKLSSHPIVQVVTTPDEITAMFDLISYEKGASVLRMLEGFLSEEVFQNGVNSFLNRFAYDNAVTQDLWDELTAAWEGHVPEGQKNDVGPIMDSWTKQMGYPVVSVEETSDGALKLTQKRFLQDPTASYDPNESEFKYTWDIPVRYITSASPSKPLSTWFYRDQSGGQVDIGDATWYKINADQIGYYRVNYEPKMWQKFEDLCDKQILGPADRSSLYDDAFALADASLLDYNVALNFSRSLAKEDHYVPWLSAKLHFGAMIDLLLETNVGQSFKKYVEQTVDPIYTKLGWNNDGTHLDKLLRNQIVSLACVSSHETCLLAAGDLLQSWISDAAYKLPLGTKRQVYRNGLVKAGSEENWDVMWERCLAEQSATERDNLYYGLANSKDENILTKYIKLAQDEKNVRTQDFLKLLQYIASNPAGSNLVWKWVRENWDWLVSRYTLNDRYLGQLVPSISEYFATEQKLKEMQDFFAKYPDAGAGALYREQALETVKFNIRWVSNNSQIISQWLDKQ